MPYVLAIVSVMLAGVSLTAIGPSLPDDLAWLRWTFLALQLTLIILIAAIAAQYAKRHPHD